MNVAIYGFYLGVGQTIGCVAVLAGLLAVLGIVSFAASAVIEAFTDLD